MTILVTGGSKGIGLDIAKAFAPDGEPVLINYRSDAEAASRAKADVEALGAPCTLIPGDAGTAEGCRAIAEAARATVDRLDVLVHCAVDAYATGTLEAEPDRFAAAAMTNGASLLFITQACLPMMARGSTVFFLSSRGSKVVVPNYVAIGAGKAMAECLVRYMAPELAPKGIRINIVSPGIVETDAVRTLFGDQTGDLMEHAASTNPSGRGVEPHDYTGIIRFLASPEADYITGQNIAIGGGANLMA